MQLQFLNLIPAFVASNALTSVIFNNKILAFMFNNLNIAVDVNLFSCVNISMQIIIYVYLSCCNLSIKQLTSSTTIVSSSSSDSADFDSCFGSSLAISLSLISTVDANSIALGVLNSINSSSLHLQLLLLHPHCFLFSPFPLVSKSTKT